MRAWLGCIRYTTGYSSVSFSLGNQYLLCVLGAYRYTFRTLLGIAFSRKPLPFIGCLKIRGILTPVCALAQNDRLLTIPSRTLRCNDYKSPGTYKKKPRRLARLFLCWHYLSSRQVTLQVLSARMSLTSVFGMGTGGPSSQSIPTCVDGI